MPGAKVRKSGRASGGRKRGRLEKELAAEGQRFAGVDEVGRGCLAGPVFAACAVLDFPRLLKLRGSERKLIRDSKLLTPEQRADIVPVVQSICLDWQVASASVGEIERIGILQASFLAMRRALALCSAPFDILLVDGKHAVKGYSKPQRAIIKGDNLCYSIAAASILAKEARDAVMHGLAESFPEYGFTSHVGYGTKQHLAMIKKHGICQLHRRTFEPIRPFVKALDQPPALL